MNIDLSSCIGPYTGVTRDSVKILKDGRAFRVILYGAYNAYGLIGPEHNGIAILNEESKTVVTDCMGQITTGYFGPSAEQIKLHDRLMNMQDSMFISTVNDSQQNRYHI